MHCVFCPSDDLTRKRSHINDSHLKSFIDQIHELGIQAPILCNVLGESLLNKKIYQYLDLFEEYGHAVTLITNAILLEDENIRKELLKHNNLTLALSIQTPGRKSFKMRGYPSMSFRRFFKIPFKVIEEKFRMGSSALVEIHIASDYWVMNDPALHTDSPIDLWKNFPSQKKEKKWLMRYIKRLERFAKKLEKKYKPNFENEKQAAFIKFKDLIGNRIAVTRETWPENYPYVFEDIFWGYMFMPDVLLKFKLLGLWNKNYRFLRRNFPPDKFLYIEENVKPICCSMTDNLGILTNGDFVFCCIEYEGEMKLGNIAETKVKDLLDSERRAQIRQNATIEPVCRRCKGDVFVMDTHKPDQPVQKVNHFGQGWETYEKNLYETGGRWTTGRAWSYVYTRIDAKKIKIRFFTEQASGTPFQLNILSCQDQTVENPVFIPAASFTFYGETQKTNGFEANFDFKIFSFYRIELSTPTFIPDEKMGNGDKRSLGIALFDMEIL